MEARMQRSHMHGRTLRRTAVVTCLVAALAAPAVHAADDAPRSRAAGSSSPLEQELERAARAAAAGIERGVAAAKEGVRRGAAAAARGVERGAQATARAAQEVARQIERALPPPPPPGSERTGGSNRPGGPSDPREPARGTQTT